MDRIREGRVFQTWGVFRPLLFGFVLGFSAFFPPTAWCQTQPIQLEGLIITGTPIPRTVGMETAHITVLEGERLREQGMARAADALAEVPGLVLVQNGSYGSVTSVFFRGAEADHVKVLVDGIEVNQAGGSFDFSGLLLSDVERIEVARGPASALYGSDALAGVINILTRRGQGAPHASVGFRGGSYGRQEWSADVHGGSGSSSYSLSASQVSSDGILEFNNRFRSTHLSGAFFVRPDERTHLSVTGRFGDRVYHYPTDGAGNAVDQNAFTFGDEVALGLEASRMLTERMEASARIRSYSWDGGSDDQPDGPEDDQGYMGFTSLDSFDRATVDLRVNVALLDRTILTAGAELEESDQRSFSESLTASGTSSGRSRHKRSNLGYYTHLTSEKGDWSGNLGIRLEQNEQYGRFLTYQAGLSVLVPSSSTRLRGRLGKGFKEPTFFETYATGFAVGNPELVPEQSLVWELGAEQTVGETGILLSLTWFDQRLEDLIQYTYVAPSLGDPNYYNVAEARSRGLEATLQAPMGPLRLTGGYTYLDTEVLDAGFDEGDGAVFVEGKPLIRRPEHQANLTAFLSLPRGHLSANLRAVGARADRDFTSWPAAPVELDRYLLVSLEGGATVFDGGSGLPALDLQFRVENLFDQFYQEVLGFRSPGRAFLFGGKFRMGE